MREAVDGGERDRRALALVALGDQIEKDRGLGLGAPHVAQVVQQQLEVIELSLLSRYSGARRRCHQCRRRNSQPHTTTRKAGARPALCMCPWEELSPT